MARGQGVCAQGPRVWMGFSGRDFDFSISFEVCLHALVIEESLLPGGWANIPGHLWLVVSLNSKSVEYTVVV